MLTKEQFLSLPRKFFSHTSTTDYHSRIEIVGVNGVEVIIHSDVKILKYGRFGKPRTTYRFKGENYYTLDKLIEAINKNNNEI